MQRTGIILNFILDSTDLHSEVVLHISLHDMMCRFVPWQMKKGLGE